MLSQAFPNRRQTLPVYWRSSGSIGASKINFTMFVTRPLMRIAAPSDRQQVRGSWPVSVILWSVWFGWKPRKKTQRKFYDKMPWSLIWLWPWWDSKAAVWNKSTTDQQHAVGTNPFNAPETLRKKPPGRQRLQISSLFSVWLLKDSW